MKNHSNPYLFTPDSRTHNHNTNANALTSILFQGTGKIWFGSQFVSIYNFIIRLTFGQLQFWTLKHGTIQQNEMAGADGWGGMPQLDNLTTEI